MTEAGDRDESLPEEKPPETATIIDASAQGRSRVQGPESQQREAGRVGLEFLRDVPLRVSVILAETSMPVGEILALETDSVVQLDKLTGEPVDIFVEGHKLGRGEVLVLQEKLRIRVIEVTPPFQTKEEPTDQEAGG